MFKTDWTQAELVELFKSLDAQCIELMKKKNSDYGNSWAHMRPTSITDEMLIKVLRIRQLEDLQAKGLAPQVSEGIEAELRDIRNYAAFRYIQETQVDNV